MKTAAVFSDNMVLQRGMNVRVFGTCDSDKPIYVSIPELNISAEAVINEKHWEAVLPALPQYDCCTLEVTCGAIRKIFRNVAIGEVWLAGGQSNMEFELHNDKNGAE